MRPVPFPFLQHAVPRIFPRLSPRLGGMLAALVTVLIWTAFIVVSRAAADPARAPTLTPWDIVLARLLGAGTIALPLGYLLNRRQAARASGEDAAAHQRGSLWGLSPLPLGTTVRVGLFGGLTYPLLTYEGFTFAPAAHASVLLPGSLPLWTALLAWWLLGQRVTPVRLLGLACIVAGDVLVGGASLRHGLDQGGVWRGDLLFIAAAVVWAVYSIQVRRHGLSAVYATVAIAVFACLVYVPLYLLLLLTGVVPGHFFSAPLRDVLFQMGMQGVGSVIVSGITYNIMIRRFGPVRSTMLTALVPGLSAVAAAVLLQEPLPWNVVCGLLLVTSGIVFGVRGGAAAVGDGKSIGNGVDRP